MLLYLKQHRGNHFHHYPLFYIQVSNLVFYYHYHKYSKIFLFYKHAKTLYYTLFPSGLLPLVCSLWSAPSGLLPLVCSLWSAPSGLLPLVCSLWSHTTIKISIIIVHINFKSSLSFYIYLYLGRGRYIPPPALTKVLTLFKDIRIIISSKTSGNFDIRF